MNEGTLTSDGGRSGGATGDVERQPVLVVALDCAQPRAVPVRIRLGGVERVDIRRAPDRGMEQRGTELTLVLADRWMSTAHARLERRFGAWFVEDAGSKNGTAVNGARVTTAQLVDGDVIAVGHTLLLFRAAVTAGPESAETFVPALARTLDELTRIAPTDLAVLIHGESGTGKELLARALHAKSGRRGELVAVNCGAIPPTLFESELFGHRRGAFSGALENRPGLVRAAEGGTLFLDEIGDLPAAGQAALLRVLQEREVLPVGETKPVGVDVRVVAATHRDLPALVARGGFRHDLYARLIGHRVELPPLRERREDLGLLVRALVPSGHPGFELAAGLQLFRHRWPLNVRELESCLASATALAGGKPIGFEHLPPAVRDAATGGAAGGAGGGAPAPELDEEDSARRALLVDKLRAHRGNVSAVARELGEHRRQVQRWLARYGIEADEFKV